MLIEKIEEKISLVEKMADRPQKFGGVERLDLYTPTDELQISNTLHEVEKEHNLNQTLLTLANKSKEPFIDCPLSAEYFIKVGPVQSFGEHEMAQLIFEQSINYANRGTMGDFPFGSIEDERELLATFLQGNKETVVISFQKRTEQNRKMIGGCLVSLNLGKSVPYNQKLDLINNNSSIPTFQALKIGKLTDEGKKLLSGTMERSIANGIRFWRQEVDVLKRLGINDKTIAKKIVSYIPFAYKSYALRESKPVPTVMVVDTHDNNVINLIEETFGAKLISGSDNVESTPNVLSSVLAYHYGGERYGGYGGKISVYGFETQSFLDAAMVVLHSERAPIWDNDIEGELMTRVSGSGVLFLNDSLSDIEPTPHSVFSEGPIEIFDLEKIKSLPINSKERKHFIQIKEKAQKCGDITDRPFKSERQELEELINDHKDIPDNPEDLINLAIVRLNQFEIEVSKSDLSRVLTPVCTHFANILKKARKYNNTIDAESRWIYVPQKNTLAKHVGPSVHALFDEPRLVGLVPEEAISKLRQIKIGSIGASVASSSLEMFIRMGVTNIDFWDAGVLSPTNAPRMPGGSFINNGRSKVNAVCEVLHERNPYGNFNGFMGKVIPSETDRTSENDITFDKFAQKYDVFLEVADAASIKLGFTKYMAQNYPNKPVFFIADVGSNPFSNLTIPSEGNLFGQGFDISKITDLLNNGYNPLEQIRAIVGQDFPPDIALPFALGRAGIVRFWSQTPISANESAAIAAKLLIKHVSSQNDQNNKNVHLNESPNILYPYTDKEIEIIKKIDRAVFSKVVN